MGAPYLANLQSGVFCPPASCCSCLFRSDSTSSCRHTTSSPFRVRGSGCGLENGCDSCGYGRGGVRARRLPGVAAQPDQPCRAASWAPWVLFCWGRFATSGRACDFVWLVLALSAELLGGSPENLLLTLFTVAVWTVCGSRSAWRKTARLFGYLTLPGIVTAALCAVQLLPTLEYLGQSSRAGSLFEHIARYFVSTGQRVAAAPSPFSGPSSAPECRQLAGPGALEGEIPLIQSYYVRNRPALSCHRRDRDRAGAAPLGIVDPLRDRDGARRPRSLFLFCITLYRRSSGSFDIPRSFTF